MGPLHSAQSPFQIHNRVAINTNVQPGGHGGKRSRIPFWLHYPAVRPQQDFISKCRESHIKHNITKDQKVSWRIEQRALPSRLPAEKARLPPDGAFRTTSLLSPLVLSRRPSGSKNFLLPSRRIHILSLELASIRPFCRNYNYNYEDLWLHYNSSIVSSSLSNGPRPGMPSKGWEQQAKVVVGAKSLDRDLSDVHTWPRSHYLMRQWDGVGAWVRLK